MVTTTAGNTAFTEDGGTVSKIAVSEGDVVQEGDLIAVVS